MDAECVKSVCLKVEPYIVTKRVSHVLKAEL